MMAVIVILCIIYEVGDSADDCNEKLHWLRAIGNIGIYVFIFLLTAMLNYSIYQIRREIKKSGVEINNRNFLIQTIAIGIFTLMTLLSALLGAYEETKSSAQWFQILVVMYFVLLFLLEGLLLFFLWNLEFKDRTYGDDDSDGKTDRGVSLFTESWDEEAEEQACIWSQFVRNRRQSTQSKEQFDSESSSLVLEQESNAPSSFEFSEHQDDSLSELTPTVQPSIPNSHRSQRKIVLV